MSPTIGSGERVSGALSEFGRSPAADGIPPFDMKGKIVLDVGCGNGKDLTHPAYMHASRWGIDPDSHAIKVGRELFQDIHLVQGYAEALPFPDAHFDVVMSRVALPYVDMPQALREMARVLKGRGYLYLHLHDWPLHLEFMQRAIKERAWKRVIDLGYATFATGVYAISGKIPRKPWGGRECFQPAFRIRRDLLRIGFEHIVHEKRGRNDVWTAKRR